MPTSADDSAKSKEAPPLVGLGCTRDNSKVPEASSPTAAVLAMRSSLPEPQTPLGTTPVWLSRCARWMSARRAADGAMWGLCCSSNATAPTT